MSQQLDKETLKAITKDIPETLAEVNEDLMQAKKLSEFITKETELHPSTKAMNAVMEGNAEPDKPIQIAENEDAGFQDMSDDKLKELLESKDPNKFANQQTIESMTDEEAIALLDIANKFAADEDFNVYAALPDRVRTFMTGQLKMYGINSRKSINGFCRMMVEELVGEMKMDKEFKAFQDDLEKTLAIPEIIDMYAEHTRDLMEKDLLEKANHAVDEEKAIELRAISKAYTDSYTLTRQKALFMSDPKVISQMHKHTGKHFNRLCDDFDYVLSKSRFKVQPVKTLVPSLMNLFKITEPLAKGYVAILCLTCRNMTWHNMDDVWFMYSSVRNIATLTHTSQNRTEFSQLMINTIKEFLESVANGVMKDCEV